MGIKVFLYPFSLVCLGASIVDQTCSGATIALFVCRSFPGHVSRATLDMSANVSSLPPVTVPITAYTTILCCPSQNSRAFVVYCVGLFIDVQSLSSFLLSSLACGTGISQSFVRSSLVSIPGCVCPPPCVITLTHVTLFVMVGGLTVVFCVGSLVSYGRIRCSHNKSMAAPRITP